MTIRHDRQRVDGSVAGAGVFARSEEGTTSIEYALIASLIAATIVGAVGGLGDTLRALPLPALVNAFASVLP